MSKFCNKVNLLFLLFHTFMFLSHFTSGVVKIFPPEDKEAV